MTQNVVYICECPMFPCVLEKNVPSVVAGWSILKYQLEPLVGGIVQLSISLLIFLFLLIFKRGTLKSPTIIVDFSTSSFSLSVFTLFWGIYTLSWTALFTLPTRKLGF